MNMMIIANRDQYLSQIRELFDEYLQWVDIRLVEEYGIGIGDVPGYVEGELEHIDVLMPPQGRLLLSYVNDRLAGMGALKELGPRIGEIKRMYVRPEFRRQGLGRALLNRLLEEAEEIGYQTVRLDSAPFLHESHQLYRASGFRDIEVYEGNSIPKEFHSCWIFMEKELQRQAVND